MFGFIEDVVETYKTLRNGRIQRDKIFKETDFESKDRIDALKVYKTIWPKAPYSCCDSAHEAGFIHGFHRGRLSK